MVQKIISRLNTLWKEELQRRKYLSIRNQFQDFTMVPIARYLDNLAIAASVSHIPGDVIECGVWRGGMSAGMATVLGNHRHYYLFDSFEGLPPAADIDGQEAIDYQKYKNSPNYFDNCSAEPGYAEKAMSATGQNYTLIKGWFNETIPAFHLDKEVALLRLDGDWYESTMVCLEYFFDKMAKGGIIIIDDYFNWDGCTLAVHDFLSSRKLTCRIRSTPSDVCYICI